MHTQYNNSISIALRRRIGRAIAQWNMIKAGDNVLVGLSGGKDSLILLHALHEFSRRSPQKFSLAALTVKLTGMNTDILEEYCREKEIRYVIIEHPIMEIINLRKEKSPCSFCANMRRGILSTWASQNGYNKLALGHTLDDAIETFFMNLFNSGRARSFKPVAYMSRTNVTIIRPLVLSNESAVIDDAKKLELPIIESACPFAGHTERQRIREYISDMKMRVPDLYGKILNALENLSESESWQYEIDS